MNKKILGFVPIGTGTFEPFDQVFDEAINVKSYPEKLKDCDAVIVWGGGDISPTLYNEPPHPKCGATEKLSRNDEVEWGLMQEAIKHGIPIIGVCRGAQMACAAAGGKLVQHVTGHHSSHLITTDDGKTMLTSSVHHQMMYPWKVPHKLIARASKLLSSSYDGVSEEELEIVAIEPEIVYFPKIKALAIQGHPEFMSPDSEFVQYCMELTKRYVLKGNHGVC